MEVLERARVQTEQQVSIQTQPQATHQEHLERTVKITPGTVVAPVLVVVVLTVERQATQVLETTAVLVESQGQTTRPVAQRTTVRE